MQVVLAMFRSDGERRSFSVVRNMTVIGRREDCDLRIPVGDVSRKHCRLVRTDASIRIEDLGSSNGTYVNGTRVQESDLQPGDIVGIGPVQFIVQIDGVPDENQMTPPAERVAAPVDEEDSMVGHQMSQAEISPDDQLDMPAAEEYKIEDELLAPVPTADDSELGELPLSEPPVEVLTEQELPLAEASATENPSDAFAFEESPIEELSLEEDPLAEMPAESLAADPEPIEIHSANPADPEELPPEELPAESLAEDEIPMDEIPVEEISLEEISPEQIPLEELAPQATPAVSPMSESSANEPIALAGASHDEEPLGDDFDFLDELEPEPAKSAAAAPPMPPQPPAALKHNQLLPANAIEETVEEVDLDSDETLPHDGSTASKLDPAEESDWDFVVEEADGDQANHDFKVDLDSPHQQPHGQS